jgi:3-deoxy-manno-octulosonate cytidylyltransferase (CMP-KDO synthetase)
MEDVICIIPARLDSKRLPGKPLFNKTGKFLIQYVYENAIDAKLVKRVIVATDSPKIADAVRSFGGDVIITIGNFRSGTDRVAEVAKKLDCEMVINLQCDEPEMEPSFIDYLIKIMGKEVYYATLATRFKTLADFEDPNKVKVVLSKSNYALYFSRLPIPFSRQERYLPKNVFLHLGIYGYRKDFLIKFTTLKQSTLEKVEGLEQLRALENDYNIKVGIVKCDYTGGIDTKEDYERFVRRLQKR